MTNGEIILDLLREVREEQRKQSDILNEVRRDVEINTNDLADHIEGVRLNREEIKEHRERLEELEQPKKIIKYIKGLIVGAATISGSVITLLKVLDKF
jgi:hypothetical protein